MKKLIISLVIFASVFIKAPQVAAKETTCTQSYGQPVVCGTKTPEEHVPIKAGLADINLPFLGSVMISLSGVLFIIIVSKRLA